MSILLCGKGPFGRASPTPAATPPTAGRSRRLPDNTGIARQNRDRPSTLCCHRK